MPFDIDVKYTIPARGSWDVSDKTPRERLIMLRDFLRTDAPNVAWSYCDVDVNPECGTAGCALGWYAWLTAKSARFGTAMADFGLTLRTTEKLFIEAGRYTSPVKPIREVTPTDVADAIDRYLAS